MAHSKRTNLDNISLQEYTIKSLGIKIRKLDNGKTAEIKPNFFTLLSKDNKDNITSEWIICKLNSVDDIQWFINQFFQYKFKNDIIFSPILSLLTELFNTFTVTTTNIVTLANIITNFIYNYLNIETLDVFQKVGRSEIQIQLISIISIIIAEYGGSALGGITMEDNNNNNNNNDIEMDDDQSLKKINKIFCILKKFIIKGNDIDILYVSDLLLFHLMGVNISVSNPSALSAAYDNLDRYAQRYILNGNYSDGLILFNLTATIFHTIIILCTKHYWINSVNNFSCHYDICVNNKIINEKKKNKDNLNIYKYKFKQEIIDEFLQESNIVGNLLLITKKFLNKKVYNTLSKNFNKNKNKLKEYKIKLMNEDVSYLNNLTKKDIHIENILNKLKSCKIGIKPNNIWSIESSPLLQKPEFQVAIKQYKKWVYEKQEVIKTIIDDAIATTFLNLNINMEFEENPLQFDNTDNIFLYGMDSGNLLINCGPKKRYYISNKNVNLIIMIKGAFMDIKFTNNIYLFKYQNILPKITTLIKLQILLDFISMEKTFFVPLKNFATFSPVNRIIKNWQQGDKSVEELTKLKEKYSLEIAKYIENYEKKEKSGGINISTKENVVNC